MPIPLFPSPASQATTATTTTTHGGRDKHARIPDGNHIDELPSNAATRTDAAIGTTALAPAPTPASAAPAAVPAAAVRWSV
eukprot:2120472-Alexandrium_andersonii.AAC.1